MPSKQHTIITKSDCHYNIIAGRSTLKTQTSCLSCLHLNLPVSWGCHGQYEVASRTRLLPHAPASIARTPPGHREVKVQCNAGVSITTGSLGGCVFKHCRQASMSAALSEKAPHKKTSRLTVHVVFHRAFISEFFHVLGVEKYVSSLNENNVCGAGDELY